MVQTTELGERRTSVDDIFDVLHEEIVSLQLKPGDRISEAEIASRFNVSRQPVRDAFNRLANLDLLLIRPQRATEVRRFSLRKIEKSRFIRIALEKEVLRRACVECSEKDARYLDAELAKQEQAMKASDVEMFGKLDYAFHQALCAIGKVEFAFDVILEEKTKVDRLCVLGLEKGQRIPELVEDHREIAEAVKSKDPARAERAMMLHLSRLDETIGSISQTNANFFEHSRR